MIVNIILNSTTLCVLAAFLVQIYRKSKPGQLYQIGKKILCKQSQQNINDINLTKQQDIKQTGLTRKQKQTSLLQNQTNSDKNLSKTKQISKLKHSVNKNPSKAYRQWFLQNKQTKSNIILNLLNDNSFGKQPSEESLNLQVEEQQLQYIENQTNKPLEMYNPFINKYPRKVFQFTTQKQKENKF